MLHFENYRRVIDAGQAFPPGIQRDKFMYGLVGVMAAHIEPEKLTELLKKVSEDMNLGLTSPARKEGSAQDLRGPG